MQLNHMKNVGDVAAATTALATVVGWLPAIAAAFTIVYTFMRIVNEWDAFVSKIKGWFGAS